MGWGLGFSDKWNRWVGYYVPAICDFPTCNVEIDRGLDQVCCDGEPHGGEGCGLHFCPKHHNHSRPRFDRYNLCSRCFRNKAPFTPKPETMEWVKHLMTDSTWQEWRDKKGDGYEVIAAAWEQSQPVKK